VTSISASVQTDVHPRGLEDWQFLRREIYAKAIKFTDVLSFDFRVLLTDANNVEISGRLMWQLIRKFSPEVIIGPGFGSTPLLYSVSIAALSDGVNLQVLMIRDKRKGHNQKKWVEGNRTATQGKRAIVIDDFMSSGSALPLVKDALRADKVELNIVAMALFFDMWEPLGSRQIVVSKIPLVSLFSRHDVGLSRDCYDAKPPLMKGSAPDFIGSTPKWWSFNLNSSLKYPTKCTPVIAENAVFVGDENSNMWRHDLMSGEIDWCVPSLEQPLKAIVQRLQYSQNSLVYGCYDGTVTRVDSSTGAVLWRWKIDSSIHATPCIDEANDRFWINTEQWNRGQPCGHLQCVSLSSGRLLWKFHLPWWPPASTAYCEENQIVVAPCNDMNLYAFNANTGERLWSFKTNGLVRGFPVIFGGRVTVASELGYLHCLDVASGGVVWTIRYGQALWHQMPLFVNSCVIVMDGKWHITAFDVETGALRWLSRLRSPGTVGAVRYGKFVVVLSKDGHVAVFDPLKEKKLWEGSIPGIYHQPPAMSDQIIQPDMSLNMPGCMVAASTTAGLVAYDIHPFYSNV
jgi:outer membrane protein assembly factor BamB/orotate phosphoribosyltransferase